MDDARRSEARRRRPRVRTSSRRRSGAMVVGVEKDKTLPVFPPARPKNISPPPTLRAAASQK
eukprot:31197-Pelagococcus_subviridis.AAC.42